MAFEDIAAHIYFIEHIIVIVGNPQVTILKAYIPGLFPGRLKLGEHRSTAIDLVYSTRVGIVGAYPKVTIIIGNARHIMIRQGDGRENITAHVELCCQRRVGAARRLVDDPYILAVPGHSIGVIDSRIGKLQCRDSRGSVEFIHLVTICAIYPMVDISRFIPGQA